MPRDRGTIDLTGLIDMHMHTAPDVRPRLLDDIEAAQQAAAAGMRAIVLKSHVTMTAGRAALAAKVVPGISVFGGLALNDQVGGLNPAAADAALRMGARVIWLPTFSADNHRRSRGEGPGIKAVIDGQLSPALPAILELIVQHDAILATGHLSVAEILVVVRAARAAGVRQIVITHPELPFIAVPAGIQEELRDTGAYFERCFCSTTASGGQVSLAAMLADIRRVGVSSTILATDFGQAHNPPPVTGLRQYIAAALDAGFSWADILCMARDNPARLLDLA